MSTGLRDQRPIPGWADYSVDAEGVVYSRNPRGRYKLGQRLRGGLAMRPTLINGYPTVKLYRPDGSSQLLGVHVLVARAFHGRAPFDGAQARHLDGDKQHNAASNLAWGSAAENEADKMRHGRTCIGERNHQTKFGDDAVRAIRRRYADGERITDLSREFGVVRAAIYRIVHRKTWRHVTDEAPCQPA